MIWLVVLAVTVFWLTFTGIILLLASANGAAVKMRQEPQYRPKPRLVVDNTEKAA
jgi:hypothetical protein